MAKTGEYVGDPNDPKMRVGRDGLTQHDREWDQKLKAAYAETHRPRFIMAPLGDAWERIFGGQSRRRGGNFVTTKRKSNTAPAVHVFTPEFYPALGKVIRNRGELRAEMRLKGMEHMG